MRRVFAGVMACLMLTLAGCSGSTGDIESIDDIPPQVEEDYLLSLTNATLVSQEEKEIDAAEVVEGLSPSMRTELVEMGLEQCRLIKEKGVDGQVAYISSTVAAPNGVEEGMFGLLTLVAVVQHLCPSQEEKLDEAINELFND